MIPDFDKVEDERTRKEILRRVDTGWLPVSPAEMDRRLRELGFARASRTGFYRVKNIQGAGPDGFLVCAGELATLGGDHPTDESRRALREAALWYIDSGYILDIAYWAVK